MRVSMVIPLYNTERFVGAAIESALAQHLPPLELIVVDDGSSDGGPDVARSYGDAVTVLVQPHRGVAAARNCGIRHTRGDAIAFLDADDLAPPNRLAIQVAALRGDPRLEGVVGAAEEFVTAGPGDDRPAGQRAPRSHPPSRHFGTLLVRRESFLRVGFVDEGSGEGEQLEWFARAAAVGLRLGSVPEVVMRRRLHDGNMGLRIDEKNHDYLRVVRDLVEARRSRP